MKALTDKIIEALKDKQKSYIGHEGEVARQGIKDGIGMAIGTIEGCLLSCEFEEVAREVMRFMADRLHPHHTAIITSTDAELSEGIQAVSKVMDYIKD